MNPFQRTPKFAHVSTAIAATLLAVGCRDALSPTPHHPTSPSFAVSGATAEIRGTGSIGAGAATPGSSRQDFDLDITSDLAGHLTFTDWSIVRSGNTVATITVSPNDIGTYFSAVRDGSSVCADPTHGMEIDATGRLDTGGLFQVTIFICDNGSPGTGVDFFRLFGPTGGPYDPKGTLSSGDLVKTGAVPPTAPDARISGVGAIGTGTATLGSNRQDFDFDVNGTPGGRMKFTDYSAVLSDGTAGA